MNSTTSRYIIQEIGKKDIRPLIDEKKGKKGKRAARLLVFFHHRDLAGDRFLLRKELAGGRRPPDPGVREGGAGGEGRVREGARDCGGCC